MSEQAKVKGFRTAAKPSKGKVMQENNMLKTQLDQLSQTDKFLGQQLFQMMQNLRKTSEETMAIANLLRLYEQPVGTEIQAGDTVMLDSLGVLVDTGKPFKGGYLKGVAVGVGSKNFVPGFEDSLIGLKVGDIKDIAITFPENYVEELKSKKASFKTAVLKIWRPLSVDTSIEDHYQQLVAAEKAEAEAAKASEAPNAEEAPKAEPQA